MSQVAFLANLAQASAGGMRSAAVTRLCHSVYVINLYVVERHRHVCSLSHAKQGA